MFDQNVYTQLAAIDPNAAAQYLATAAAAQATATLPPPPVPQATFQSQPNLQQGFQQQAAAPQQVAARGTLEDFFNQPSGGGGPSVTSKFFNKRPQGSWLQLTVLADVTNADVQHQKTPQNVLQYFKKNGQDDLTRPKLVLVVKVSVTGSSDGSHVIEFPDGTASLWLKKGVVTDNLVRAMTAAGDPSGYPKAGAQMVMVSAGEQASRTVGFNATKLYDFQYAAPAGTVDANPTTQIPSATAAAPGVAPAISVPPVTAAPVPSAVPTIATAPPAAPALLNGAATPSAVPNLAPVISAAPAPAVVPAPIDPTPPPPPVADDPKAAERARLLAQLQGL